MNVMKYGAAAGAAVLMSGVLYAQSPAQQGPTAVPAPTQAQRPAPGAGATTSEAMVTVMGCVQREADYRKAQDAGKGGVVGTGVGVGNEFVLNSVSAAPATATAAGNVGAALELTGPNESQAEQHVGKRVEITGKLKAAETAAAGQPTGGPTAGAPPRGVDVTSRDLKLREIEIATIKSATGTCPA